MQRDWHTGSGVLTCSTVSEKFVPSASEIYGAIFKEQFSARITKEDVQKLKSLLTFSKYPVYLFVDLINDGEGSIAVEFSAKSADISESVVYPDFNADHILIENVWYPIESDSLADIGGLLAGTNIRRQGKISLLDYLTLARSKSNLVRDRLNIRDVQLKPSAVSSLPKGIKASLYPYQTDGWKWLSFMLAERVGGVLADEMGLGKSLQVIALTAGEQGVSPLPCLIICPATLLENWRREFQKFAPNLQVVIHQGSARTGFPMALRKWEIIITSYDTAVRDNSLLSQISWKLLICDEAQALKNPQAKRTQSIKKLPREVCFAVTGTPIENRLQDLWSIIDLTTPGYLGPVGAFNSRFEQADGAAQLEEITRPLILRRKIAEVAKDLPSKIIIPQIVELSNKEVSSYEALRIATEQEFATNASLVVLTRLRMFCAHPVLATREDAEDLMATSTKYTRLIELVDEIVLNGAKVLIFTSYNQMNDLLVDDLRKRFLIPCDSIDGRTPTINRQQIVDSFSSVHGPAVLVLNPQAAGTGLNITAANHVIHYNPEWNPAKEDQASARAYRRGQDRPVTIHRLIYANTVEEIIDDRLNRKRTLADTAIMGVQGRTEDYDDLIRALTISPKSLR